ncbi:MAG: hypothetical protein M1835_002884, partial [Candelina submexicana]
DKATGSYACPASGGAFCAGKSLAGPIIIRCNGTLGLPGNCNDNLASIDPRGTKDFAPCWQTSTTTGDAACSYKGTVYPDSGCTFSIDGKDSKNQARKRGDKDACNQHPKDNTDTSQGGKRNNYSDSLPAAKAPANSPTASSSGGYYNNLQKASSTSASIGAANTSSSGNDGGDFYKEGENPCASTPQGCNSTSTLNSTTNGGTGASGGSSYGYGAGGSGSSNSGSSSSAPCTTTSATGSTSTGYGSSGSGTSGSNSTNSGTDYTGSDTTGSDTVGNGNT